jgi:hypothetical protein
MGMYRTTDDGVCVEIRWKMMLVQMLWMLAATMPLLTMPLLTMTMMMMKVTLMVSLLLVLPLMTTAYCCTCDDEGFCCEST